MKVYTIGNLTLDIIVSSLQDVPLWGTEENVDKILYRTAGNLSNVIFALKKMEINPIVFGNVGNDLNGKFILDDLIKKGIDTSLIKIEKNTRTSITIALIRVDGERIFITYPGQLSFINGRFLNNIIKNIENNSIVFFSSLFQFPNLELDDLLLFFKKLKEKKCLTSLDTGWDPNGWSNKTITNIKKMLKYIDIFLPNLIEAQAIAKTKIEEKLLKVLKDTGVKSVIIKKGAKGSIALINDKIIEKRAYKTICRDSTGAGDAFNAGIIYSLIMKKTNPEMLQFANATSSIVISKLQNRYPTINEIEKIIKKNRLNKIDED